MEPAASDLGTISRVLADDEFAALRSLAFSQGTVLERDGLSVLGFGAATSLRLPRGLADREALAGLADSLARIDPRAIALGSFHFLPDREVSLVVPSVCIRRAGKDAAQVVVAGRPPDEGILERLLAAASSLGAEALGSGISEPPDSFQLRSRRPHDDFLRRLAAAVDEVRSGRLEKVVMAREVVIEANRPFRQADLLERLRTLHPSCAAFAVEGFVGASPELLIRRSGASVESHPLAGTAARSGDPEVDRQVEAALLASDKERAEHRAVVEAITGGLRPAVSELVVPDGPSIVELRNVSHLGTHISGTIAPGTGGRLATTLELLALIHPTPAVSGTPLAAALAYLESFEDLDRDRYAGAVGWVDGEGDGEWHLGIRCALVDGTTARLFAGVGIVAHSDPRAELAETQLKLQAFLAAAVRP